jgi:hypothetical protein
LKDSKILHVLVSWFEKLCCMNNIRNCLCKYKATHSAWTAAINFTGGPVPGRNGMQNIILLLLDQYAIHNCEGFRFFIYPHKYCKLHTASGSEDQPLWETCMLEAIDVYYLWEIKRK